MTANAVQTFLSDLSGKEAPRDAGQPARQLVKARKLTAYQAQMIYKGKTRRVPCPRRKQRGHGTRITPPVGNAIRPFNANSGREQRV